MSQYEFQDDKTPILYLELCDQRDSGFIQDGTENTPHQNQLRAPGARFIPNVGYRRGVKEETVKGKKVNTKFNEKIQYIRNETEISAERQKFLGIEKSSLAKEDKIVVEKGYMTVAREGAYIGLYDYIMQSYYNETNKERSEKATAIYRIVERNKEAEESNEMDIMVLDAMNFVSKLYTKIEKGKYTYNTAKIDGICEMLQIFAESEALKIKAISQYGRLHPEIFLKKVTKWEQITETEVTHGLQLGVIGFNKGVVQYMAKDKIIKTIDEKMSKDEKISSLADWFRISDGHEAYMEFQAELEAAKDKN